MVARNGVGFTGTREGLTAEQTRSLAILLRDPHADWFAGKTRMFHHGGCCGADSEASKVARNYGYWIVRHPADKGTALGLCDVDYDPKPFLKRDRDIVDECRVLIACPLTHEEERRSGTWATIRYARARRVPLTIVWPDGEIEVGATQS